MKHGINQKIKSGYDKWKRNVLRCCLNITSDGADVTCDGRLFQKRPFANGGEVERRHSNLKSSGVSTGMARQWHGWHFKARILVKAICVRVDCVLDYNRCARVTWKVAWYWWWILLVSHAWLAPKPLPATAQVVRWVPRETA